MPGGLRLDAVIRKCEAILQLFTRNIQTLLNWRNDFYSQDSRFHVVEASDASTYGREGLLVQVFANNLQDASKAQELDFRLHVVDGN